MNKSISTFFFILLISLLGVSNAWGETKTYTLTDVSTPSDATADGFTFTFDIGSSTNAPYWNGSQGRLYSGGNLVIESSTYTITEIVYTYAVNASKKGAVPTIDGVEGENNEGTWNSSTKTWSDSKGDTKVSFYTSGSGGNLGFTAIKITYGSACTNKVTLTAPTLSNGSVAFTKGGSAVTSVATCDGSVAVVATITPSANYVYDGTKPTVKIGGATLAASNISGSGTTWTITIPKDKTGELTMTVGSFSCAAKLTVNCNTPTHGTYTIHKGNNASGEVVSNGDVFDNCSGQSLYIVFTPDAGYEVTAFEVTNKNFQDPTDVVGKDHVRCDYSAGTKTTNINVTFGKPCTTPTISFAETAITKYMGDANFTITPTISGNTLGAAVTYSSDKETCATVNASGEVTIKNATGTGAKVTITATLAAKKSGDDCQQSVSASYTITILNKVTWSVNGTPYTVGNPTTEVTEGASVTKIPADPDGSTVCDGKTFMGWTTALYTGSSAPSPLLKTVSDFSDLHIDTNTTFYAVFATASGSAEVIKSETLECSAGTISNKKMSFSTTNFSIVHAQGEGSNFAVYSPWRVYTDNTVTISGSKTITSVEIECASESYATAAANASFTPNTASATASGSTCTITLSSTSLVITPSAQTRWKNIKISYKEGGTSYSDYTTSCTPPTTWSVVYDANGKTLSPGVNLPAAVTDLEENVDFTVPANNYVSSPDYAQIGWNTDATATTGLTTVPGQTAGTVVTLYAIWQKSQVEVVEVNGNNDIIIEHNFGGNTGAELDKWATGTELKKADEPFISKYFEATGSVKLIGIFNGTGADIDPQNLRLRVVSNRVASNIGTSKDSTKIINLSTYRTEAMPSGTEYILYSHDTDDERDQRIMNCVKGLDGINMTDWIEISWTTYSPTLAALTFGGADAVVLEQKDGSTWKILDIVGALRADGKSVDPSNLKSNSTITWGDAGSGGKNRGWYCTDGQDLDSIANEPRKSLELATLRCLLVRKPSVVSGAKTRTASGNLGSGNFNTLCSEWYGKHVELANEEKTTCDAFAEVGSFNYKESYEKYITVTPDQFTATNNTDGTMTIHIDPDKVDGGLASLSCDMLKIKVTDNTTGDVLGQVEYKVPIIVTASGTETDNAIFTKFDDCSTCDVVILQDATLAPNASGKNTIRDLEIYRGAKLNVPNSKTLTVNNLIMRSKGDVTPQADILGTLNRKDTKLYFDKRVDENQWYWIALPYDCNMADVTFRNGEKPTYGVGKDWVLKTYNGVKRADTQAGGCWEVVPENSTLKAGVGYILGVTPKTGHAYVEIRFPMTATQWDKDRTTVTVPVTPTASQNITPNHVGWNLVGNPYLTNYAPGYVGMDNADNTHNLIPLGLLQENAENEYERVGSTRYVVIPQNGGYSEYKQVAIGDQKLPTFMSYFIQIDGNVGTNYAVDFKYANSHYAASPMRRAPEEYMEEPEDNHPVWVPVTLANVKGEKDETTFLISNQFTDKYDMMDDLIKWRGDYYQYPSVTTKPVLASRNSETELAFNALPDNSAWNGIPLNYFAAGAGMFTIELSDKYGLDEVAEAVLYDAETKVRHDLKSESYTFSSARTDNTDRFTLYIRVERKKAPEVATDFGNLTADDKPQKVLVNGNVYILRGGKVFDITGKQVR